ncbi:MAG: outer membrane beta-barrel protein [Thermoguttaceae bacterium]|nr:outer membrane beta-barrel protein [Thermoguttaceae bacterium]
MKKTLVTMGVVFCLITSFQTATYAQYPDPGFVSNTTQVPSVNAEIFCRGQYQNDSHFNCGSLNQESSCSCGAQYCPYEQGLLPCFKSNAAGFFVDGWVSGGVLSHSCAPLTLSAPSGPGSINSEPNDLRFNQSCLAFGREAVRENRISWGARVDLLYGADYLFASSLGLETANTNFNGTPVETPYLAKPHWNTNSQGGFPEYGFAMPQLYGEVYLPFLSGTSVKLGHFYSPLGYESIMSPSNFFYTHTYSKLYGEPQTLTGMMIDQKLNDNWGMLFGITQGWNAWEDPNHSANFTLGSKWENDDKTTSLSLVLMTGKEQVATNGQTTNYSLVLQKNVTKQITWVLQHDLGIAKEAAYEMTARGNKKTLDAHWYSVANYLYWQMTDTLSLGGRFEWFCDHNHSRIMTQAVHRDSILPGWGHGFSGQNYFDLSLGLNWKPTKWMTIRPEVRYDWSDIQYAFDNGNVILPGIYKSGTKDNLVTVGGDCIIRF